jgi:hypothetical protein
MYIVVCYVAYLVVSLAATVWVARTLRRNGRTFLIDAFHGNTELADFVNHLLVVGFYLINVGYVALALRTTAQVADARAAMELVCDKLGLVLIVLGAMHFLNLYVLSRLRQRGQAELRPPIPPNARISIPSEL